MRREPVSVRPVGDAAVLIETTGSEHALALAQAVRAALGGDADADAIDVVPGERTVLVRWAPGSPGPQIDWPAIAAAGEVTGAAAGDVVIEVRYGGDDLAAVAAATGLSPEEVVRRHRGPVYRAAFCGFAPGFAYLTGGDQRLALPRRERPRERVPAGSVAVAGPYSAVYPTASPGGWHLLGHTDAVLFDTARERPALLTPGTTVRFVEARG